MNSASSVNQAWVHPGRWTFFSLLFALAAHPALGAPDAAPPKPKPYALFLGADLEIQQGNEFCRVQDVSGDTLIARVDGRERPIPTTPGPISLRVQRSLKLASTTVTIADLKAERAYTPAADPARKWSSRGTMPDTGAAEHQFVTAQAARDYNAAMAANPKLGISQGIFAAQVPAAQAALNAAQDNFSRASADAGGDLYNAGLVTQQMQEELDKKLFDAVDVGFSVSSPQPLTNAYVVLLAQYHDPNDPKGTLHNWIYAKALESITDRARQIHIKHGGFPPGFELEKLNVHLYDHGQEVASNIAEKRVELTRDEAFQYTVIDYVAGHKDSTLPPTLAMGQLPPDLPARLQQDKFRQTYYVRVYRDGLPEEVYIDASCRQRVDDHDLQAVIKELRFKPALEKGKPVEGVAPLKLSDLHQ